MHYDQIPGWFDCEAIFEEMVAWAPPRAVFVEVGAYLGRSTACLASQIVRSGKDIRLHVVDLWDGWFYHDLQQDVPMPDGAEVFGHFLRNMEQCGVDRVISPLKMHSLEAAALFDDESVDFVWLDGDHGDEAVERDLRAWFPKVRWRGFLGGHDYANRSFPGVARAVNRFFGAQHLPFRMVEGPAGGGFLASRPDPGWFRRTLKRSLKRSRKLVARLR